MFDKLLKGKCEHIYYVTATYIIKYKASFLSIEMMTIRKLVLQRGLFLRNKGVCLCPIRVSASERLSRGGKWRLVTQRCVISKTAPEQQTYRKVRGALKNNNQCLSCDG